MPSVSGSFALKINDIGYGFRSIYFNYDFNQVYIDSTEEFVILPEDLFNNFTKAIYYDVTPLGYNITYNETLEQSIINTTCDKFQENIPHDLTV
jgi:hypothetical protein